MIVNQFLAHFVNVLATELTMFLTYELLVMQPVFILVLY